MDPLTFTGKICIGCKISTIGRDKFSLSSLFFDMSCSSISSSSFNGRSTLPFAPNQKASVHSSYNI